MPDEQFNAGDLVRLKSGGPVMTVETVTDTGIMCVWIDTVGNRQIASREAFAAVTLAAYVKPQRSAIGVGRGSGSSWLNSRR